MSLSSGTKIGPYEVAAAIGAGAHQLFQQLSTTTWDTTPDKNRFLVELSARQVGATLSIVTNWFEELLKKAPARK